MTMLDDDSAIHVLKTIAQARLRGGADSLSDVPDVPDAIKLPAIPELRNALAGAFSGVEKTHASEGDLARAALALLAQDPEFAAPIEMMARQAGSGSPAQQRYFEPATIALTTAAFLVLQTHVKLKLDHQGKWSIEIDKKAAGDGAVKLLVQRLLSLLG
jgi:hypothetical protein